MPYSCHTPFCKQISMEDFEYQKYFNKINQIRIKMIPTTFQQLIESFETPEEAAINYENMHKLCRKLSKQDVRLFNDFHPIGCAFFSNEITKRDLLKLFDQDVVKLLKWESWTISIKNQQDIKKWQNIFKSMKEAQISFMQIPGIKMPRILKMISHVGFFQLTHLNLHKCGIQNIEALTFIDAPNLKILNLIYNNVYEYKSLKKTNFQLNKLFLYSREQTQIRKGMPFVNMNESSRWDFPLESLRLEKYSQNEIIGQDLSFLSKMKKMQNAPLHTNISMFRRVFQKKLCRRYYYEQQIKLFVFRIDGLIFLPQEAIYDNEYIQLFHIQMR